MRCVFIFIVAVALCYFVESKKAAIANSKRQTTADDCSFGYYFNGSACEKCGLTTETPKFRIIGGTKAVRNSWPSYVYVTSNGNGCGGFLVNRKTVVTAAHCIPKEFTPTPEYPTVESATLIGINQYSSSDWTEANKLKVSKIIRHPLYNVGDKYLNDVAVVILETPITISEAVYPACLPVKSDIYPEYNISAYVAGWGLTIDGSSPKDLLNVNITVYDPVLCDGNAHIKWQEYYKSAICAGDVNTGFGSCNGDSGGALYTTEIVDGQKVNVASGIVSFGSAACGTLGWPVHYTRVSYYIDWIKSFWEY